MAVAADAFFGQPTKELTVAGVTGTNGKTTTCFLVYEILVAAGRCPGLLGTVESRVGGEARKMVRTTPEAIDLQRLFRAMIDGGDRSCVMEASSHAIELHRLDRVHFSALAFTNLSHDHLDFHETMERYFTAKRRIFLLGEETPAAINIDDPWGRRLAADLRTLGQEQVLTFGRSSDADLHADEIEQGSGGTRIRIGELELRSSLCGAFNAENLLTAVALARLLGIEDGRSRLAWRRSWACRAASRRSIAVRSSRSSSTMPTPRCARARAPSARELTRGRLICVFGCGGDRDREKRPLMGEIAAGLSDLKAMSPRTSARAEGREIVPEKGLTLSSFLRSEEVLNIHPLRDRATHMRLRYARGLSEVTMARCSARRRSLPSAVLLAGRVAAHRTQISLCVSSRALEHALERTLVWAYRNDDRTPDRDRPVSKRPARPRGARHASLDRPVLDPSSAPAPPR